MSRTEREALRFRARRYGGIYAFARVIGLHAYGSHLVIAAHNARERREERRAETRQSCLRRTTIPVAFQSSIVRPRLRFEAACARFSSSSRTFSSTRSEKNRTLVSPSRSMSETTPSARPIRFSKAPRILSTEEYPLPCPITTNGTVPERKAASARCSGRSLEGPKRGGERFCHDSRSCRQSLEFASRQGDHDPILARDSDRIRQREKLGHVRRSFERQDEGRPGWASASCVKMALTNHSRRLQCMFVGKRPEGMFREVHSNEWAHRTASFDIRQSRLDRLA